MICVQSGSRGDNIYCLLFVCMFIYHFTTKNYLRGWKDNQNLNLGQIWIWFELIRQKGFCQRHHKSEWNAYEGRQRSGGVWDNNLIYCLLNGQSTSRLSGTGNHKMRLKNLHKKTNHRPHPPSSGSSGSKSTLSAFWEKNIARIANAVQVTIWL